VLPCRGARGADALSSYGPSRPDERKAGFPFRRSLTVVVGGECEEIGEGERRRDADRVQRPELRGPMPADFYREAKVAAG
jgi:hypothetical protein